MDEKIKKLEQRKAALLAAHKKPTIFIAPIAVGYFLAVIFLAVGGSTSKWAFIVMAVICLLAAIAALILMFVTINRNKPINAELRKINLELKSLRNGESTEEPQSAADVFAAESAQITNSPSPQLNAPRKASVANSMGSSLVREQGSEATITVFEEAVVISPFNGSSEEIVVRIDEIKSVSVAPGYGFIPGVLTIKEKAGGSREWGFLGSDQAKAESVAEEINKLLAPKE